MRKLLALTCLACFANLANAQASTTAPRLVTVSSAMTEIAYLLNAQDQLVGVDTTSQYPEAATKLPQVGYQRQLSAEGLLSLKPDIVITTDEAGPPTVLEQIKAAGVNLITVPEEHSPEGVVKKIQAVGTSVGKTIEAEKLINDFKAQMATTLAAIPQGVMPSVVFLLNVGNGAPMAAGHDTAANAMLNLIGARNVFADSHKGYKPVSSEAMIAANPDVVMLSKETLEALGGIDKVLEIPGVALTTAGKNKRIVTMESRGMLGFGPRLPEMVKTLAQQLHKGQ